MEQKIKSLIQKDPKQCISYATFIQTALYDNEAGYYMKEKQKIGKSGDFYTSTNVHGIFAKVIAKAFIEVFEKESISKVICEIGAGTGKFAATVLEEIKHTNEALFHELTYIIIESSPYHRKEQQKILPMEKVMQFASLEEAKVSKPNMNGIIFSNELFDAFPVHVVEQGDLLEEIFVSLNEEGKLMETKEVCTDDKILKWLKIYYGKLNNGQRLEIPLAMTSYMADLCDWLDKGTIFTIDYGYTNAEWGQRQHRNGSLRGFSNHTLIDNPLTTPGEMDLTTHIHFDALKEVGQNQGLKNVLFLPQDQFLLAAGILTYLQNNANTDPFSPISRQNRAIRQFITAGGISSSFRVLVQSKKMNQEEKWSFVKNANSY
ncbi:class I SAM-dependent methyltransferase [Lottiidibacillus patelloidae]|nr:SAM-dependent methyltransferase [Lottiidibacillus patelloidae]